MRAADLCLIPVRPSEADVKATMPTIRALHGMGQDFALVINQAAVNKQARLTAAVVMRMSSEGVVLPLSIANRDRPPVRLRPGAGRRASTGRTARPRRRSPSCGPAAGRDSR